MPKQRNPFARTVTRNTMRGTETVVTILEDGVSPRVIGEFITFSANKSQNVEDIPIGGESGFRFRKRTSATREWEATFYTGTDGNFWEQMDIDEDAGTHRPFVFITSDRDDTARDVGERVREYSYCRLNTYTDSGMSSDGRKITTIGGTYESYKLIKGFDAIQGVV